MSSDESQISAIPPDRYGDRFVKFIQGVTKTREEAEKDMRRAGSIEDPSLSNTLQLTHIITNPGSNPVIRKAEEQADRSRKQGHTERNVPDRQLLSIRSPSAERGEASGFTLPVVEEAAESQSLGGRSGRSGRSQEPPVPASEVFPEDGRNAELDDDDRPPPTPPKDSFTTDEKDFRPPTPPKDFPVRPKSKQGEDRSSYIPHYLDPHRVNGGPSAEKRPVTPPKDSAATIRRVGGSGS